MARDYDNEWFTFKGTELKAIVIAEIKNFSMPERSAPKEFWTVVEETLGRGRHPEVMGHEQPMTYRQIREFVYECAPFHDLAVEELSPGDAELPWAVERWLTHEMLPTIRKTGRYQFPADLDQMAESGTVKA
jgi:hypothetical protein